MAATADRIDRIASYYMAKLSGSAERYDAGGEGRWITIGSDKSAPRGEKGGTPVFIKKDGEITKGPPSLKGRSLDNLSRPAPGNELGKRPGYTKAQEKDRRAMYEQYDKDLKSEDPEVKKNAYTRHRERMEAKYGHIENKIIEYTRKKEISDIKKIIDNADELSKKKPHELTSLEYIVSEKAVSVKSFEKDYKKFYDIANEYRTAVSQKDWAAADSIAKKIENIRGFSAMFARVKKASDYASIANLAERLHKLATYPEDITDLRWDHTRQEKHKELVKAMAETDPDSIGKETLMEYRYCDWMPPSLKDKAHREDSVKSWTEIKGGPEARKQARAGRKILQTANAAIDYYRDSLVKMQLPATQAIAAKINELEKTLDGLYQPWIEASHSQDQERMDSISEEIKKTRSMVYEAEDEIKKQSTSGLLQAMGFSGKATIATENAESLPESQRAEVATALDWLSSVVGPDINIGSIKFEAMDPDAPGYNGRSHCRGNTVFLAPHAGADVIIHEIGHAIEHANGEAIGEKSLSFMRAKTADQPVEHMGNGYTVSEVATQDGFMRPYTGKYYYGKSTEILSMGLQALYEDAHSFARRDKDHFNYTIAAIRGLV